jgi:hypothetical protein
MSLAIALVIAVPWYVLMVRIHGWEALAPFNSGTTLIGRDNLGLLARLFEMAPVTLPLGAYGAARALRRALVDEDNTPETVGGSFWLLWLAIGALTPAFWTNAPRAALDLLVLVPLNLLAASTIADLVNRRVPVRSLIGLAPATAMSVAWWASEDLQGAMDDLIRGQADVGTALGLHLALDLVLVSIWFTRRLERWAHQRDDRQRQVLACFLLAVLVVTVASGIREVVFRHSETHNLLTLRTMILRRNRERPFEMLAVVAPELTGRLSAKAGTPLPRTQEGYSGGWLRFILRTALPHLPQRDLTTIDELLALPEGQRLIILARSGQGLSYADKSKLGLESIHPGLAGVLEAYATAHNRPLRR